MINRRALITIVITSLIAVAGLSAQDMPHEELELDCEVCHSMTEWSGVKFDHVQQTGFALVERHAQADCKDCHTIKDFSIIDRRCVYCHEDFHDGRVGSDCSKCHTPVAFSAVDVEAVHLGSDTTAALTDCVSCHRDIHEAKLGPDCAKCHTPPAWDIFNIEDIHAATNFPLMGRHALVDCQSCHNGLPRGDMSFNTSRCEGCHQQLYLEVTSPNHVAAGFPTDCDECHQMSSWRPAFLASHDAFFPIFSGVHAGEWDECSDCHKDPNNYLVVSCFDCHGRSETDENHDGVPGYSYNSQDCLVCHPNGRVEEFVNHDQFYFPIFSGPHNNVWDACSDCHDNPADRTLFNCLACHEHNQTDMDNMHQSIGGYTYLSTACYTCHPDGEGIEYLEHDALYFPIYSGVHVGNWSACTQCHTDPTDRSVFSCLGCHEQTTVDGIHSGIPTYTYESTACLTCHPTGSAAEFTEHDVLFFPVYSGTHAEVWDACSDCHTDPADKSVFSCTICHTAAETNPIHGGITSYVWESSACLTCHPTGEGGEYTEHDALYFPIYSGTHDDVWDDCATCHINPDNRSEYDCLGCHVQTTIDVIHQGMTSYTYQSTVCFTCHPQGVVTDYIEHDADFFPIYSSTHAAAWSACSDCHTDPNDRSVVSCVTCHDQTTTDAVHDGITTYTYETSACLTCHPTGEEGDYPEHDAVYFPIYSGTHNGLWAECATCHTVPGDRSIFDCLGCHEQTTVDVIHMGMLSYSYESTVCFTCHPSGVIEEYTEHDGAFFPIYSGTHSGVWVDCANCHTDPADRSVFTCLTCHVQGTIDPIHLGMTSYTYESSACLTCHPVGNIEDYTEHDADFFPIYSGAHVGTWVDCSTCHTDPGDKSVFTCLVCHDQTDTDNMHAGITGYAYNSTDCLSCHPDGSEIEFTEHELSYFPIYSGAHAGVWTECATCHPVVGDRTVYDCLSCHEQSSTDIVHMGMPEYSYVSTVCYGCHPAGVPEDYPQHDVNGFFPIYSGTHNGVWAECATCHTNPNDRSVYDCLGCHTQGTIDPVHLGMPEYSYESSVCYTCHPSGVIEDYLSHDVYFFPIYSGTHIDRWASCATCHIDPMSKAVFSCLVSCHPQNQTDNRHLNPTPIPGYVYDSYECYNCHPTGYVP